MVSDDDDDDDDGDDNERGIEDDHNDSDGSDYYDQNGIDDDDDDGIDDDDDFEYDINDGKYEDDTNHHIARTGGLVEGHATSVWEVTEGAAEISTRFAPLFHFFVKNG